MKMNSIEQSRAKILEFIRKDKKCRICTFNASTGVIAFRFLNGAVEFMKDKMIFTKRDRKHVKWCVAQALNNNSTNLQLREMLTNLERIDASDLINKREDVIDQLQKIINKLRMPDHESSDE